MSERTTIRKNQKRRRPEWTDQPAFLDASATVSAATFGARRLPEIKALWSNVSGPLLNSKSNIGSEYLSSGGKTSSRHLRRRTTSHLPRRRHRYPTIPEKRAARTTDTATVPTKRPCRRARRKPALLRQEHQVWCKSKEQHEPQQRSVAARTNSSGQQHSSTTTAIASTSTSSNHPSSTTTTYEPHDRRAVHWLTTHLWHVKRFHMHDNLFGWKVPLVHANRGGRAALRMAAAEHNDCRHPLLQDVTWRMQPLVLGSSSLKTLVACVQRFCPNLLSSTTTSMNNEYSTSPNAILSGSCFGQGVLYEPDKFPAGAIGPASWWMCGGENDGPSQHVAPDASTAQEQTPCWRLYMFLHPAIRTTVCKIVLDFSQDTPLLDAPDVLQGGMACLQLRGTSATMSLKRALGPIRACLPAGRTTSCTFDWDRAGTMDDLPTHLPYLTVIPATVCLEDRSTFPVSTMDQSARKDDTGGGNDGLAYIASYKDRVRERIPTTPPSSFGCIGNRNVILVSQRPNDPASSPHNSGVTGWDIFCHPSEANDIFQALTIAGKACAIGLVEESILRMDSEPPLPVFPRDYPDSVQGQVYWNGSQSDWQLVRHCLEEGWGRVQVIRTKKRLAANNGGPLTLPAVTWRHISALPENASMSGTNAVVVRGDFGKPFVDALAGCGHISTSTRTCSATSAADKAQRRPRRRVRPPSESVSLCRLSVVETDEHQNACEALLGSLSLPALLRCHVKVEGKGTLSSGGRIVAAMHDVEEQRGYIDYLLGFIVAGSFSMNRGLVHGIGFVGAARLLHVLSSDHGRLSCVAANMSGIRSDCTRHVELKVSIQGSTSRGCAVRSATISLLK